MPLVARPIDNPPVRRELTPPPPGFLTGREDPEEASRRRQLAMAGMQKTASQAGLKGVRGLVSFFGAATPRDDPSRGGGASLPDKD